MGLDIRLPIGLMFSVFGVTLAIFGFTSDKAIYAKSLGLNVNLGWGIILLVFGALMLFAGLRGNKKAQSASRQPSDRSPRSGP